MHVVITGASTGIGAALARQFALLPDAKLTLVARRRAALEQLAAELSAATHVVVADLSDREQMSNWLPAAEDVFGPVDVLVNNAGVQVIASSVDVCVVEGERSLELNLLAPLRLTRQVLPSMVARRAGQIVNVASMAALAPTPSMTYYNAGKAGLAAASEAMRGELRGTGVGVLTAYPGIIAETEMAQAGLRKYESTKMLRMQPTATAAELARAVVHAVKRGRARVILPRFNWLARWWPGTTRWVLDRFAPKLASNRLAQAEQRSQDAPACLTAPAGH
jgi:short-subunit dehydrogenase